MLGDEVADPGGAAQPARPGERKGGDGVIGVLGRLATVWHARAGPQAAKPRSRYRRRDGLTAAPRSGHKGRRATGASGRPVVPDLRRRELPEHLVLGAARGRLDARLLPHPRRARTTCCCAPAARPRSPRGSTSWRGSPPSGSAASTTARRADRRAAGFALAGLAALGFSTGIEAAQAGFVLLMPLVVVGYSKLRLALAVRRRGITGTELVLALARRRVWHQFIAVSLLAPPPWRRRSPGPSALSGRVPQRNADQVDEIKAEKR